MNPYERVIHNLYTSFQKFDPKQMAQCYHPDVTFEDPAFGELHGADVMNMWSMLIARAKPNIQISYSNVVVDGESASAHWEAQYPFSRTGRDVHNMIRASFLFKDDLIFDHRDDFDLHAWAAMAFGWKGRLFGGRRFFKNKIRSTALLSLEKWKSSHSFGS